MKILIDMNLSPLWRETLEAAGHQAVHWVEIGDRRAPDSDLLAWAAANAHIVFTHDLDFSRLLARSGASSPSVIQVRTLDPLPESLGLALLAYLDQFAAELQAGAIVIIEPGRARARILPIREL